MRVVHDAVTLRTRRAAAALTCHAAGSVTELVESPEVEAILLADPQWHRLWAVGAAIAVGKPVLIGSSAALDDPHLAMLASQTRGVPVLTPFWLAASPSVLRLRDLFAGQFGNARLMIGQCAAPAHRLAGPPASAIQVAAACAELIGLEALGTPAVRLTAWREPGRARASAWLRVVGERGAATVVPPGRLSWSDPAGSHTWRAPDGWCAAGLLLARLRRAVREGVTVGPPLDFAAEVVRAVREIPT